MSANVNQPAFRPVPGGTVNLSVTDSSANLEVQAANTNRHVRIYNSGTVTVFVCPGADNTVEASTTADMPVAPGTIEIISCPHPYIAAIGASAGPTTVYFTPGEGL
jgi:hypothetical protein